MVLVDSCIWIEAARREGQLLVKLALRSLLDRDEAAFCGPISLEFLGGARDQERGRLKRAMAVVPYVPMTDAQWEQAIQLSWRLREKGITAPWNDVLIASLAVKHECRVYSLDKHFAAIAATGIVRLYQPGYSGMFTPE